MLSESIEGVVEHRHFEGWSQKEVKKKMRKEAVEMREVKWGGWRKMVWEVWVLLGVLTLEQSRPYSPPLHSLAKRPGGYLP